MSGPLRRSRPLHLRFKPASHLRQAILRRLTFDPGNTQAASDLVHTSGSHLVSTEFTFFHLVRPGFQPRADRVQIAPTNVFFFAATSHSDSDSDPADEVRTRFTLPIQHVYTGVQTRVVNFRVAAAFTANWRQIGNRPSLSQTRFPLLSALSWLTTVGKRFHPCWFHTHTPRSQLRSS